MKLYLLVGNIASGKSTFARKACKQNKFTVCVSLDILREMINGGEYIFDQSYERTLKNIEDSIVNEFMWHKYDIIIDDTSLVSPLTRALWINTAAEHEYKVYAINFPTVDKKTSVARRLKNPHGTYNKEVWENVWDMFNMMYKKPDKKEGLHGIYEAQDIGAKLFS